YEPDAAVVRLPAERQYVGLRVRHQLLARRTARREQTAVLRLVPRLARAPERSRSELAKRARSDQHHVRARELHVSAQSAEQAERVLLAAAVQQAEPSAQQRDD